MPYRVTAFDWALFAGLVVAWGSSFVMSKLALQHFTPEWIAAMRLIVGAAVLMIASAFQSHSLPRTPRDIGFYALLGLIGNAAPFFVITWGMQFITSGVAGLLMGTIPLIIIVMAHFALPGERLTLFRTIGFILGFAGIVVLMGPDNLSNIRAHGQELIGQLAVISGCLMYGMNSIAAKRFRLSGTIPVSAAVLTAGAVLATINAALQSPLPTGPYHMSSVLAVLGLGLIPTGLATVLWFKAVERTSPTFTSMSNYLVPVYALLFGALTLGESVGLNVIAALALIMTGIFISRMKASAA
jgi:drug/metabolite transporter (DMT)-like permease